MPTYSACRMTNVSQRPTIASRPLKSTVKWESICGRSLAEHFAYYSELEGSIPKCRYCKLQSLFGGASSTKWNEMQRTNIFFTIAQRGGKWKNVVSLSQIGTFSLSQMSRTELARVMPWRENEGWNPRLCLPHSFTGLCNKQSTKTFVQLRRYF